MRTGEATISAEEAAALHDSWSRIRRAAFAKRFYARLLARDARARAHFAQTDFLRQEELLEHALRTVIENAAGSAVGKMAIARLGRMHGRKALGIDQPLYDVWVACFYETLSETDPELTSRTETLWRRAIDRAIALMLSHFDD